MHLGTVNVFDVLTDKGSLEIFNVIANKGNVDSKTLQSMNGFTKKQYYSRTQQLIANGLVKRKLGVFSLTSFGKVIYHIKLKIDAAVKEYFKLKVIDSIKETNEIHEEAKKRLINDIISDKGIKMILLSNKT